MTESDRRLGEVVAVWHDQWVIDHMSWLEGVPDALADALWSACDLCDDPRDAVMDACVNGCDPAAVDADSRGPAGDAAGCLVSPAPGHCDCAVDGDAREHDAAASR